MADLALNAPGQQLAQVEARAGSQLLVKSLERGSCHSSQLTEPTAIRQVVDAAFAELGPIEIVVSNAAYGLFGAAEEVTDEQVHQQIATNLLGSIHLIRAALPHLRA